MRIVITGSAGLVGKALSEWLSRKHIVRALTHAYLDVIDVDAVLAFCRQERPELIINCAVLQVDQCEEQPDLARAVNVDGPRNLANAAHEIGAQLLHFSTNYVFDGKQHGRAPYTDRDATNPINVYGETKLAGERAVLEALHRSYVVRTAWVYGPRKESFLAGAHKRLLDGQQLQAITDAYSTTTFVNDLVKRVEEIIAHGRYGIYHIVNEGVCSYYEFAVEAARLIGLDTAESSQLIVKVKESELQRRALRPLWTPLACRLSQEVGLAPMRNWRDALAEYILQDAGETK